MWNTSVDDTQKMSAWQMTVICAPLLACTNQQSPLLCFLPGQRTARYRLFVLPCQCEQRCLVKREYGRLAWIAGLLPRQLPVNPFSNITRAYIYYCG